MLIVLSYISNIIMVTLPAFQLDIVKNYIDDDVFRPIGESDERRRGLHILQKTPGRNREYNVQLP